MPALALTAFNTGSPSSHEEDRLALSPTVESRGEAPCQDWNQVPGQE